MELKQIEYFLRLAQTQHVSQTADLLNISQPTLSKSLASLERELGLPLFDRVGHRLRLNANGQQFYDRANEAMRILTNAVLVAKRSVYKVSGSISIVCLSFPSILMPCLCEYMELNPGVKVQLCEYDHDLSNAAGAGYGFVLCFDFPGDTLREPASESWVTQILFSEEIFFVIGPNHPQYQKLDSEAFDLRQFAGANFVTMRESRLYSDMTYSICEKAGFFPRSFFQTDTFLTKMDILRDGAAVSFLPESNLEKAELLCPGLRAFPVDQGGSRRNVLMKRKKKSLLNEAELDFWDFLLEYFHLPPDVRD